MKTNIRCKRYKGIARAETPERKLVAQLRCKQWDCDYCAVQNAKQWRAAIIHYIVQPDSPQNWSFWTITMPTWVHAYPDEGARYSIGLSLLQANWDKFMKRAKRAYGKFQYARVVETHASGAPHIHLMASVHILDSRLVTRKDSSTYHHSDTIKAMATDCNFGYIHDVQNIVDLDGTNKQAFGAANYVTKYITKDLKKDDDFRKKMRVRKIQTSRGIKRVNLDSEYTWTIASGVSDIEILQSEKEIFDVTTGNIITMAHLRGGHMYPPIEDKE